MKVTISTSYINAYSIYRGLKKLGIHSCTTDKHPALPIPACPLSRNTDYLFFTEESSLLLALTGNAPGKYFPQYFPLNLLDDKFEFALWLSNHKSLPNGLRQWPLDEYLNADYPCLIKAKSSWRETVKMPRGWICLSPSELEARLNQLSSSEYNPNDFFIQEWLGDLNCKVVSVCGFFDSQNYKRNLVSVVERIASHSKGLSCSAAIQTVEDNWNLIDDTEAILGQISFIGPYELEYLILDDQKYVLELNPRFWMQHSIFLDNGNGLIKRYLGLDTHKDYANFRLKDVAWIDAIYLILSILRLRVRSVLRILCVLIDPSRRVSISPPLPIAILFVIRNILKKLLKSFNQ